MEYYGDPHNSSICYLCTLQLSTHEIDVVIDVLAVYFIINSFIIYC
jgi:hypothetical protein